MTVTLKRHDREIELVVGMDWEEAAEHCQWADGIRMVLNPDVSKEIQDLAGPFLAVSIPNEHGGGFIETAVTTWSNIRDQIILKALRRGWTMAGDVAGLNDDDQPIVVDLAQFDPWDISACVQLAAFHEVVVS